MSQAMDLALQEALVLGLHTLASDQRAVEELVGREDSLRHNTANEWRRALRDALLDMLDTRSDLYCPVMLGYPSPPGSCKLPTISIVVESGGENPAETVVGNVLHARYTGLVGPAQELFEILATGAGQTTVLQVGAWSPAPERSSLLIAAVKWALYQQQEQLQERGVHELSFREGGVEVSPEMEPRVAYVPMLTVTMSWTFRQTHRRKVPNRWTLARGQFST